MTRRRHRNPESTNRLFIFLMIGLMSLFLSTPFLGRSFALSLFGDIFLYLMLFAAIFQIRNSRLFWIALPLLIAAVSADIVNFFVHSDAALISTNFLSCAFVVVIFLKITTFVIRARRVSADVLMGGFCGYVLLGLIWAYIYINLELLVPGAFNFRFHDTAAGVDRVYTLLFYYSYVTLMTIGFGDIVPVSSAAQTLTVLEGLVGQMYVIFCISTLAGMYLTYRSNK